MALTPDEQKLADAANAALPDWFSASGRVQEEVGMMAKQMGAVLVAGRAQILNTYISQASGPTMGEPADWLDMLAQDRGTHRQADENDPTLRARLQRPPNAVVRSELLAEAQAMVDAATTGITTTVAMAEFPRDAAHLGTWVADAGTGGTFSKSGSTMTFTPTQPFAWTPFVAGLSGQFSATSLRIFDSASNNGGFMITGITSNGSVTYENVAGASETSPGCAWVTSRHDRSTPQPQEVDGRAMAFCDRGFRCWRGQYVPGEKKANGGFLIILPYGCDEALQRSVKEMLRQKKAAGFKVLVERRQSP